MADRIAPVLTPVEWQKRVFEGVCVSADWHDRSIEVFDIGEGTKVSLFSAPAVISDAPRLIAALNALLPDSDPRKITRERIERLRIAAGSLDAEDPDYESLYSDVVALADALESYLPPES